MTHGQGDLILFRVDDDGAEVPYTLDEHRKWVDEGMPDCAQEQAEGEDDDDGEDDDEEVLQHACNVHVTFCCIGTVIAMCTQHACTCMNINATTCMQCAH